MARRVEAPRARKKRQEEPEEHENHERWLVTYADMLTLLFVLFVVLFAMSSINIKKFSEFATSFHAGVGEATSLLTGQQSILNGAAADSEGASTMSSSTNDSSSTLTAQQQAEVQQEVQQQVQQQMSQMTQRQAAEAKAQVTDLVALWKQIESALQAQGLQNDVQATVDSRGLVISVVSGRIVFDLGSATITPFGKQVVDAVAPVLQAIPQMIEVVGHATLYSVNVSQYTQPWDLSAMRATAVVRYLQYQHQIPGERLEAASRDIYEPLIKPGLPNSTDVNKRVDIVVLSDAPGATRDMYENTYATMKASGTLPEGLQ